MTTDVLRLTLENASPSLVKTITAGGNVKEERARQDVVELIDAIMQKSSERSIAGVLSVAEEAARERASGKAMGRIVGSKTFLGQRFILHPSVLVPHTATEHLVLLTNHLFERSRIKPRRAAEIGVGSGVVAVSLISAFPDLKLWGTDVPLTGIKCALENAGMLLGGKAGNFTPLLVPPDRPVFEAFERIASQNGQFDLIVSNPPYGRLSDEFSVEYSNFEPKHAVYAADDNPLAIYSSIAEGAYRYLSHSGIVVLETKTELAKVVKDLFVSCNMSCVVWSKSDISKEVSLAPLREHDQSRRLKSHRFVVAANDIDLIAYREGEHD